MFELQIGESGGAAASTPTAPPEGATPTSTDAAAIPAAGETTVLADGEAPAAAPSESTDTAAEPSDDAPNFDELLKEAEADPRTPKWYRENLKKSQGYTNTLRERLEAAEKSAAELRSQFEGKNDPMGPDPAELERMKAAEEKLFGIQSFTAKPDEIDAFLKEANPRAYNDYRAHLVWNALEQPDGSPDMENLQFIVDRFSGKEGAVKAQDVLAIMEGIAEGRIDPNELHGFYTPEEYEAHKAKAAKEAALEEKAKALESATKFQETQIREREIQTAIGGMQMQINQQIESLMDKFKLAPVKGEPKAAADFKARTNERIASLVNSAGSGIREFAEIRKAFEILSQPGKKPMAAAEAAADVQAFVNSSKFKYDAARGMSELMRQIERVISEEAVLHTYLSKGLELENTKSEKARAVIGAPSQTANLPELTEDDLKKMSVQERRDYRSQQLSAQIRSLQYGSRLGQ